MEILPHLGKAQHRRTHSAGEDIESHQFADGERASDYKLGSKIKNPCGDQLANELHSLARGIAKPDDPEACRNITRELFLPTALHLRLNGHGLERFDTSHCLNQKGLVFGAARELFIKSFT